MKGSIFFLAAVVLAKAKPSIYQNHNLNGIIGYAPQLNAVPVSYASYSAPIAYASHTPIAVAPTTVDLIGPVHTGAILSGPKSTGAIFTGPQNTGAIVTGPQSTGAILRDSVSSGAILSEAPSHAYVAAVPDITVAQSSHVAITNPAVAIATPVSASLLHASPAVAYAAPLAAGVITKGGGSIGVSAAGAIVKGPPTAPVVIAGPSGKIEADGLWGPTLEGLTSPYPKVLLSFHKPLYY